MKKNLFALIALAVVIIVAGFVGYKTLGGANPEVTALYDKAIQAKESQDFDSSKAALEKALGLTQPGSEWSNKISDELNIHLPLTQLQQNFFTVLIDDAINTVADVEAYMESESGRLRGTQATDELVALMERLKKAIDARDKSRLSKIKSFMIQYGQIKSYRYASTKEFPEWVKPHMPDHLQMKLVKHKGDYINRLYKHEAEFLDTRHNLRIVLDTDGNEILVEPANKQAEADLPEAKQ